MQAEDVYTFRSDDLIGLYSGARSQLLWPHLQDTVGP